MKLEDVKWALRELMKPTRHRRGCECEAHAGAAPTASAWACTPVGDETTEAGIGANDTSTSARKTA